ncbi:transglycosylase SLT domain-containing protein [Pseudomaricurvus sp. HS19]|uniref:transglycosylase SLT domain-containing protein n=1 Tax=Pseudomaricurvus sp. HS19 TaxID=2692626 RepID=UPI00351AA393
MRVQWLLVVVFGVLVSGCVTSPPRQIDNICDIFDEKSGWYDDAKEASDRWGVSIPVMMAIIYQESRFQPKAKPPRTKILWIFPGPRKSSAYGFAQAKDETWDWYKDQAGSWGADRDDFADAVDFVGWYSHVSNKRSKISKNDPYRLYLAYHEGHGGYNRGTYRKKPWLQSVAKKVSSRAAIYQRQLVKCEERLQGGWWFF